MREYCKDNLGFVHVVMPLHEEYTLCGNAWDGDAETQMPENDPLAWVNVKHGPVTCEQCCFVIKALRGTPVKETN